MREFDMQYDIIVVGGGPAGLAAAIEAKRNGVDSILVVERDRELGGILQQCIHNGFGLHVFKEELSGPEYAERFIEELKSFGIEYKLDTMVLEIGDDKSLVAINTVDGLMHIKAKAVILAMGCRERTRGAINIPGTRPAGVFSAGTAQRYVNMEGYMVGKRVVILGSGDIGLIMARRMTLEGAEVLAVAELMPYSGGLMRNIVQCLDDFDIPLYLSHTLTEIRGRGRVEGVTIAKVDSERKPIPGTEKHFDCDTLLLSVGLVPENELSKQAGIALSPVTGGPIVNECMETSVPMVFACGNVVHVHDLVDWVTEEARKAGRNAAKAVLKASAQEESEPEGVPEVMDTLLTIAGDGIRYVVPQQIRPEEASGNLELMMRVTDIFHKMVLTVKHEGKVLVKQKKAHLAPGEMESIKVPAELLKGLKGSITIALEQEVAS